MLNRNMDAGNGGVPAAAANAAGAAAAANGPQNQQPVLPAQQAQQNLPVAPQPPMPQQAPQPMDPDVLLQAAQQFPLPPPQAPQQAAAGQVPPQVLQQPGVPPQVHWAPPPPQQPAQPTLIQTYRDFYSDETRDPFQNQYAAIEAEFSVPLQGNAQYGPAVLATRLRQAMQQQDMPMAVIALCRDPTNANDMGRMQVFHRHAQHTVRPGSPATPWDGNVYAIAGDIVQQQVVIVPFEDGFFDRVANAHVVLTDAALHQQLAGNPAAQLVGPHALGDADTEEVRTRYCTYVPFRYVPLFLGTSLTPREAWERVSAAVTANNDVANCRPLLDFLRLALTRAAPDTPSVIARQWPTLMQPADATLIDFFQRFVHRDLPNAHTTAPGTHQGLQQVATQVGILADETRRTRQDAQDRQARKDAGSTVDEVFGQVSLVSLMRLCHVNNSAFLPPIYADLARNPKKQRQGVLQSAITNAAQALHVRHPVFVPPGVLDKVMSLEWTTPNPDDLSQAVNPFLVGQPTPSEEIQMRQHLLLQQQVYSGEAAPSLADAQVLSAPAAVRIPTSLTQTLYTLTTFHVYLHVLLGLNHPVTLYVRQLQNALESYQHAMIYTAPASMPAWIVRYLQRVLVFWAGSQLSSPLQVPWPGKDVVSLAAMDDHSWVIPLPPAYLATPNVPPVPAAPVVPALAPTAAPVPTHPPAGGAPQSVVTREGGGDSRFADIAARGIPARVVKAKIRTGDLPVPRDARGRQRCLAWTVKGVCNTRCSQASDHRMDHTDDEQNDFLQWCQTHYVA